MTVTEAKARIEEYLRDPLDMNEEDNFVLNELCKYVFEETGDANYLIEGSDKQTTDPKYLEKIYLLSIANGQECDCYLLGNLYMSGRLGTFDYEKAYEYFLRASKTKKKGSGKSIDDSITDYHNLAKLELAKMYKNGLHVDKDFARYKEIINEVYEEVKDLKWQDIRYEELFEKAKLDLEEGNIDSGLDVLYQARSEYWAFLKYMQEERDYELLVEMNELLYRYQYIDYSEIEPEDITELLKEPITITFMHDDTFYEIRCYKDTEYTIIEFNGELYRDPMDFIMKAKAGDTWFREMLFEGDLWEAKR